jgi:hypothetical protein
MLRHQSGKPLDVAVGRADGNAYPYIFVGGVCEGNDIFPRRSLHSALSSVGLKPLSPGQIPLEVSVGVREVHDSQNPERSERFKVLGSECRVQPSRQISRAVGVYAELLSVCRVKRGGRVASSAVLDYRLEHDFNVEFEIGGVPRSPEVRHGIKPSAVLHNPAVYDPVLNLAARIGRREESKRISLENV